ncbi:MAG TPA: hypothetical protein PKN22_08270 [Taishania sp.]|nr:hypothetical protein [Taishania sp.]
MFLHPNTKKPLVKYRIPLISTLVIEEDEDNLWEERQEYINSNYPDMILSIIQVEETTTFDKIKVILDEYGIATDLGFVLKGVDELVKLGKIEKLSKFTYKLL